uniref:extracellular catalytic domain type 2 short-chain-length polyhydroxyalkanoate depolymerase n=1 Tax=Thaumasiovibrio occultus TaxID=1891184 RepID=UPI000B34CC48|nr:hypothetical protein [Thaumasiovibrio occultus]
MRNPNRVLSYFFVSSLFVSTHAMAGVVSLPELSALNDQTSLSGLSSGGFMTSQYHIAYSEGLVGVGIVAGGPWQCAASDPDLTKPSMTAQSVCVCNEQLYNCNSPNVELLTELAKTAEAEQRIDPLSNLSDDKVYLFSGTQDWTVPTVVVGAAERFYRDIGLDDGDITFIDTLAAGHGFATTDNEMVTCKESKVPYINFCHENQAFDILNFIYTDVEQGQEYDPARLVEFDQTEFIAPDQLKISSMSDSGFAYIPDTCEQSDSDCRVHVAIHGCEQGVSSIGMRYVERTGYLELAEANDFIVIFPQVQRSLMSPFNPKGCWDFWGYTDNGEPPYQYYTKNAVQMQAIKAMIDRVTGS